MADRSDAQGGSTEVGSGEWGVGCLRGCSPLPTPHSKCPRVPSSGKLEADALVERVCAGAPDVRRDEQPAAPPTTGRLDGVVDELPPDAQPARPLGDDQCRDQPDARVVVQAGKAVEGQQSDDDIRIPTRDEDGVRLGVAAQQSLQPDPDVVGIGRVAQLAKERSQRERVVENRGPDGDIGSLYRAWGIQVVSSQSSVVSRQ